MTNRRHSGFWMMKPGHTEDFDPADYLPMVAKVESIGYMQQPPAFSGDTAVIYRGVWNEERCGEADCEPVVLAETPDGYATPRNAMRAAALFYREATEAEPTNMRPSWASTHSACASDP